jgi:hypothetical protein
VTEAQALGDFEDDGLGVGDGLEELVGAGGIKSAFYFPFAILRLLSYFLESLAIPFQ